MKAYALWKKEEMERIHQSDLRDQQNADLLIEQFFKCAKPTHPLKSRYEFSYSGNSNLAVINYVEKKFINGGWPIVAVRRNSFTDMSTMIVLEFESVGE